MRTEPRFRVLALAALIGLGALTTGCSGSSDSSSEPAATDAATPAAGQEAATAALEQERTVIDVRTPEEFAAGHVEGATNLNLQDAAFPDLIADLDPDGTYVVYCRSGNRSAQATTEMTALGLDVIDGGGMDDMQAAGWDLAA